MRTTRSIVFAGTAAALALTTAISTTAAGSPDLRATAHHHHSHRSQFSTSGHAYGTRIQVGRLGGSGQSARTAVRCGASHATHRNSTAQVKLSRVGVVRAVHSRSTTNRTASGRHRTVERARTARVSLLGDLITARAITATAVARASRSHATHGRTRFIGLRIAGKRFTSNPKPNTSLKIPGVARLTLNAQHRTRSHRVRTLHIDALRLTLLKGNKFGPLGTTVTIGHATATRRHAHRTTLRGSASGSKVSVNPLVASAPTFQTKMRCGLRHHHVARHRGVGVNLSKLLKTGVIRTRAAGHNGRSPLSKTRAVVSHVNLLNGLVKVSALRAQAVVHKVRGTIISTDKGTRFVGLHINGKPFTDKIAANTKINLGVGTLWLDRVVRNAHGLKVHALQLVLGKAYLGLKKGTVIDVANAKASIRH